ncbi:M24 family metallopeptidase [Nocardioides sp. NPDC023903]|uniref:M24 family metallopeptidase n=1 Tax=Nocardioides sp. NPDC023903 TaxID=3157195 RepID=UPI0033C04A63
MSFQPADELVNADGWVPDFAPAEYEDRRARLTKAMNGAGLDAIVVNNATTHRYLSGHTTRRWNNMSRPILALYTAASDCYVACSSVEAGMARITGHNVTVIPFGGPGLSNDPAFDVVVDLVRDVLGSSPTIGYEGGNWLPYEVPEAEMAKFRGRTSHASHVDASELLWGLRLVKSEAEIAHLRTAAKINSSAFDKLYSASLVGVREDEIYRRMASYLFEGGAEALGYISVTADPRATVWSGGFMYRKVAPRTALYVDSGCQVAGYWSDFCRLASNGPAPQVSKDIVSKLGDVMAVTYEEVRPGRTWSEAYTAIEKRVVKIVPEFADPSNAVLGRFAHGIGMAMPEPPSLALQEHAEIVAGTAMCVEPSLTHPDIGQMITEEMVVVRDHGCELISDGTATTIREI